MKVYCEAIIKGNIISGICPNFVEIEQSELEKISQTAKEKPVLYKRNMVGTIIDGYCENGNLQLIMNIKKEILK